MGTPKLYQYEVCPFCWKARSLLALKGVNYDTVEVHPLNKKEISFSDYKKVPIYVDESGHQVNDSSEIMRYVDDHYEGRKIFEQEGPAVEREKQLLEWSELYVKSIPPLIYNTFPNSLKAFDYISKNSNFSWHQRKLIKYSGAAVMKLVAAKSQKKQNIEDPEKHFAQNLQFWVASLDKQFFVGGEKPNAADAAVFGITMSVSNLPASKLIEANADFYAWVRRMGELTQYPFVVA